MAKREQTEHTLTSVAARGSNQAACVNSMLDVALDCIARGWYVFPCKPRDKEPLNKGAYKHATLDEAQVRHWWTCKPDANVGIAPGMSKLSVLDVDTGLADEQALQFFVSRYNLPITFAVRTGKRPDFRVQLYFASPEPLTSFNGWKVDNYAGDVRGTWGHVMAPGCVHPESGATYDVLWDLDIVPVPDWVRALKSARKEREIDLTAPITEWRNDTLIRTLGKHRADGADDLAIEFLAHHYNETRIQPPLDEEELGRIIKNACTWPIGEPPIEITLGGSKTANAEVVAETEDAPLIEKRPRPVYAEEVWRGTPYWEFAEICSEDNHVPKKFFIESIRTVTGAVVGKQLRGDFKGCLPRAFTVLISTAGGGKGTACEAVQDLFRSQWASPLTTVEPPLLFSGKELFWRNSGLGAQVANLASAPGLMKALEYRKLKKNEARDPREIWKPLHRFIGIQEEMRGLFANFANESTGDGLEATLCELWDRESFSCTATVNRPPEYGEMMYSILGGITPELWDRVFSKVGATDSGFLSRLNIIGTEEDRRVPKLKDPDFTELRNRFFPLIKDLQRNPRVFSATAEADQVVAKWFDGLVLPENVQRSRLNVHAWRTALHLAWLRGHDRIEADDAQGGTRIADYQVQMREFYAPPEGETKQARCEQAIRKVLKSERQMPKRELLRKTHGERFGVGLWENALTAMIKAGECRLDKRGRGTWVILLKAID